MNNNHNSILKDEINFCNRNKEIQKYEQAKQNIEDS